MRCLMRLGCLFFLLVLGVGAWFTRDWWLPKLPWHAHVVGRSPKTTEQQWQPVSPAGAARTRSALGRLSSQRGQVFESLTAADIASYVLDSLTHNRSIGVDSVTAAVIGDKIRIRGVVPTAALSGTLGVLSGMLRDREPLELVGTMRVVQPGLGEVTITDARVRDVPIPPPVIPALVKQLARGGRPPGLSDAGLPVPLPPYIGDVRLANGRVTLYKSVR